MKRRSFLQRLGAVVAAPVAAPPVRTVSIPTTPPEFFATPTVVEEGGISVIRIVSNGTGYVMPAITITGPKQ